MFVKKLVQNLISKSITGCNPSQLMKLSTMPTSAKTTTQNPPNFVEKGDFCIRSHMKITLCGALGKVGQPLSLILKQVPFVNELSLYDLKETSWLRSDLDIMDTNPKIKAYCGCKNLESALKGSQIVTLLVSDPDRTFGSYQEMFQHNADIVHDLVAACAAVCPSALLCIVTNPINSLVPLAVDTYKRLGLYGDSLIYGVTTFNSVRANSIVASTLGLEASCLNVPVIGGAEGETIVPLLSSVPEIHKCDADTIVNITKAIQGECDASDEYGKVMYPFSSAYAISRFLYSLMRAIMTCEEVNEYSFVRSNFRCETQYLTSLVNFGPCGLRKNFGFQKLSEYEQCLLEKAVPILQEQIRLGEKYVEQKYPRC